MTQIRFSICFVVCVLYWSSFGQVAVAQQSLVKLRKAVDGAVEKELERQNLVGVSVGIISRKRVVYTKGYGFGDIEAGVRFSENTISNWASNSKPVMAVLAMQLVQSGKLDLDKSIDNYLPDIPEHLHAITTRQLLCHQSGIPHYSNGKIIRPKQQAKPAEEHDPSIAMKRFIQSPLIFKPGAKREYSSYAYVLLSAVVQAAGEEPIADQLANRISTPLDMSSFQMDVPLDNQENWSHAYRLRGGKMVRVGDEANYWKHGAGGYKSNVKDFSEFAASFMKAQLMSVKTTVQMMTIQNTSDGKPTTMGLGVFVSGSGDSLKVSHNGSQPEVKTRMVIYPNKGHGVVVMCNCNHADPGKISTAIYGALKKNKVRH